MKLSRISQLQPNQTSQFELKWSQISQFGLNQNFHHPKATWKSYIALNWEENSKKPHNHATKPWFLSYSDNSQKDFKKKQIQSVNKLPVIKAKFKITTRKDRTTVEIQNRPFRSPWTWVFSQNSKIWANSQAKKVCGLRSFWDFYSKN